VEQGPAVTGTKVAAVAEEGSALAEKEAVKEAKNA
jgi:hypothetical protein